ncbi:MAG: facilitated glucose transporter [Gordonia sp. (in: high G+C Gram-positive bacteria)]
MRLWDRLLLGCLIVDGAVLGVLGVGFAYTRFFGQLVPLVAFGVGLGNALLVWLAARHTDGLARFGPLFAWLAVLVVASVPGPGTNAVIYLDGASLVSILLLVVLGAGIPGVLIWSGRLPRADADLR